MKRRELIAILRGVSTGEAVAVASELIESGISKIEVPLNSPDPIDTISLLQRTLGSQASFGAGTVLTVDQVEAVAATGASLIVSPNCNTDVIRASKSLGLESYPGVMTPTECFTAIEAGANGLKFFPASLIGPQGIAALKAVLPSDTRTYAVGGASPDNFADWFAVGITGFGIGSALYKPGRSLQEIREIADQIVDAYDRGLNV